MQTYKCHNFLAPFQAKYWMDERISHKDKNAGCPNIIQNRDLLETHICQNRDPSNLSGQKRMSLLRAAKIL